MDDGDIMCHPILVPPFLQNSTSPTPKSERNGTPGKQKPSTTRTTWMQRLLSGGSATCRTWPKSPQLPLEASHSESLSDPDRKSRTKSWEKQTSFERCTKALSSARTRRRRCHGHAIPQEQQQMSLTRLGSGLLSDSSRVSGRTVRQKRPLSAGQSRIGFERARDIAAPAHLGSHRSQAAYPSNDPRRSVGKPSPRVDPGGAARLTAVIEAATSTYLSALDDNVNCLGSCRDRVSQTRPLHPWNIPAPPPKRKTATTWTSQRFP